MRAAYAALIFGTLGGLVLATGVLSRPADGETTVAGVLALDLDGKALDGRRAEAVAALVTECMRARGFGSTPWLEPPPSIPDPDVDPVTWAARWGFGVSTMVGRAEPAPADPNMDFIGAMAPDERDGYREALDGPTGCRTVATDTVYGVRERALAPLQASLRDLDARIGSSPAGTRASEAWRRCVSHIADGRALDHRTLPTDLREMFVRRLDGLGRITGLLALQVEERRVATVLAGCGAAFERARAEAATPFESAFVRDRRATIEAIGAAIRAAEAALPTLPP